LFSLARVEVGWTLRATGNAIAQNDHGRYTTAPPGGSHRR
jgi:hypothetical protein